MASVVPTVYHIQFWCSSRVVNLARELGLGPEQLKIEVVDEKKLKEDPDFVKRNPLKVLPYYESGTGFSMVESGAIVQHLLELYDKEHKLHPAPAEAGASPEAIEKRAKFLQWVYYGPASMYHAVLPIFFKCFGVDKDKRDREALKPLVEKWTNKVITILKAELSDGRKFLLGEEFSAADIIVSYDLMTASFTGEEELLADPVIRSYFERVSARPAYIATYAP